jgi:glycine dehydrogenase subunit 1
VFVPRTDKEKADMLKAIGAESFDDLLADIPSDVRLTGKLDLPAALSEFDAKRMLGHLAAANASLEEWTCFLGGGAYDHYVPSIIDHIASRSEFYTAYTPYQAEISQGTLQVIYEFQSLITRLTGMDIANASLYDGSTAIAEAVLMAGAINRRREVIVSGCINPLKLDVLRAYLGPSGYEIKLTGSIGGRTDADEVKSSAGAETCCVILENPNFLGVIEDAAPIAEITHAAGALLVASVDPISLGLLAPPGDYGADIVVGEGQALGSPLSFGGPYLGFMAARKAYIRRLPGRIVGKTVDRDGKTCFCLTLQTREQHIRRAKATSNICTNQALMALRATVYLCWLGPEGLRTVADLCLSKAAYARKSLASAGFKASFDHPFFKEFAIDLPAEAGHYIEHLAKHRILAGIDLGRFYPDRGNSLLVAFTEKRTKAEIDSFVRALSEVGEALEVEE